MARIARITHYLRGIRSSYRARIMRTFRGKLTADDRLGARGRGFKTNWQTRIKLTDAIFLHENELESRRGGQPAHPAVLEMNAARIRVEDDLYGNPWK